jgi:predicted transcriptional regulator
MARRTPHGLGTLQAAVLEFLWDHGEAPVARVVEEFSRRRPTTYTTVLVALQKLEKKGWVTHREEGRAYWYRAARSREAAQTNLIGDVLKAAFAGDPKLLVNQLLDSRPWSEEELADLRRLIDRKRRENRHA